MTQKEISKFLFDHHEHMEAGDKEYIVYREEDIIELLIKIGAIKEPFVISGE